MDELVPVDHDPFAVSAAAAPSLTPVDHDPFAQAQQFQNTQSSASTAPTYEQNPGVLSTLVRAAGSRALNLGSMLQSASPTGIAEQLAGKITGVPSTADEARDLSKEIAPRIAPDDYKDRAAEMLGGLAPDLAAAAVTGGASELPEAAGLIARGLHGASSMSLPAIENVREVYNQGIANGLSRMDAIKQALVAGGGTLAMGAIPANVPGGVLTRIVTGAGVAGLEGEGQRRLANALLPTDRQDLHQDFDPFNTGASVITGGVLSGLLGARGGTSADRAGKVPAPDAPTAVEIAQRAAAPAPEPVAAAQEPAAATPSAPAATEAQPEPARAPQTPAGEAAAAPAEAAAAPAPAEPGAAADHVLRMGQAEIGRLERIEKPTATDKANLRLLKQNADDPQFIADALGMKLEEPTNEHPNQGTATDQQPGAENQRERAVEGTAQSGEQSGVRDEAGKAVGGAPERGADGDAGRVQPEAAADLDAPNFGMPEPARPLADDHPLLQSKHEDQSPERQAMREKLVAQRFEGKSPVPADQQPVAVILGGGGASGKGTVLKMLHREGAVPHQAVELDPDSFKTGDAKAGLHGIPEYKQLVDAGDSRAASVTHDESSLLFKSALSRAIDGRYNMVLDRTMGDSAKGVADIKKLKEAGYKVKLIGVTADVGDAIDRSVKRAQGPEKRYVPLDQLVKAHKGFAKSFESDYVPHVDDAVLYDNNVPKGEPPAIVARKAEGGALDISDADRYNQFRRKGDLNESANTKRELQSQKAPRSGGESGPSDGSEAARSGDVGAGSGGAGRGRGDQSVPGNEDRVTRATDQQIHEKESDNGRAEAGAGNSGADERAAHGDAGESRGAGKPHDNLDGGEARADSAADSERVGRNARSVDEEAAATGGSESDRLSAAISRELKRTGSDAGEAPRFETVDKASLPDGLAPALDAFERATGAKIHVFKNLTPKVFDFDGVHFGGKTLHVNVDSDRPLVTVAGHEFGHFLEQNHPDLHEQLLAEVKRQGDLDNYSKKLGKEGYQSPDEKLAARELTSDAIGDALTSDTFLHSLAEKQPGVFRRMAEAFLNYLSRVTRRMPGLGSNKFLSDVNAFRDKLRDVLGQLDERRAGEDKILDERSGTAKNEAPATEKAAPAEGEAKQESMFARAGGIRTAAQSNIAANALQRAMAKIFAPPNHAKEIARNVLRSALAARDRAVGTADAAMRAFVDYYDRRGTAVNRDPSKALEQAIRFENGQMNLIDPKERPFFAAMRKMLDEQATQIQGFGKGYLDHLVTNYFPHLWKDPNGAATFLDQHLTRRPIGGGKKFTKERTFATLEEGLKAGFEPVSTNPAELVMMRYQAGEKLLTQLRIMKELDDRNMTKTVPNGQRLPKGWAHVNDPAFGNTLVPDFVAHDLNNYLDPGLTRFAAWRGFRWLQNFVLSARLGVSLFHAGMTTLDSFATHVDIGLRRAFLLRDFNGSLNQFGHALIAPLTAAREMAGKGTGSKLVRQYYGEMSADRDTGAVLDFLSEGGARGYMSPTDFNDSFTKMKRAWKQGEAGQFAKQFVPGVIEGTTRFISHQLVPAQKMTARVMHAKFRLDSLVSDLNKDGKHNVKAGDYAGILDVLHPDTLRQLSREINATIDDRLGQFAYDNELWNKTLRDALHASVQSVGWNFGTLRLLLGGAKDVGKLVKPEDYVAQLDKAGTVTAKQSRLTDRLSYLITLNATVGMAGAALQYMMTGEGPKEMKDWFFPRTGRKNPDGTAERLSFPSYVKDEFALATHPLITAQHKLHPVFNMAMELATNRDFYGTQIYNPDASIPEEAKQLLTYLGKSFTPYAVSGAIKANKTGQSALMTALPFVGVTPAPGDITKDAFHQYVADRYYDSKKSVRTQSEAEASAKRADAINAIRNHQSVDLSQYTPKQRKALEQASRSSLTTYRFHSLPLAEQAHAYEMATPEERKEFGLHEVIHKNLGQRLANMPSSDRQEAIDAIRRTEATAAPAE